MAKRRMFNQDLTESDQFLDMPVSSQLLFFHLGMNADDEGFTASPKKILRVAGCNDNDLAVLISKGYLIPFNSGVVLLKDWNHHNKIRKDRVIKTIHQVEKASLLQIEDKQNKKNKMTESTKNKNKQGEQGKQWGQSEQWGQNKQDKQNKKNKMTESTKNKNKVFENKNEMSENMTEMSENMNEMSENENKQNKQNDNRMSAECQPGQNYSSHSSQVVDIQGTQPFVNHPSTICPPSIVEYSRVKDSIVKNSKSIVREGQFVQFWELYGLKQKKESAKALFMSLSEKDFDEMKSNVNNYVNNTFTNGDYPSRMHPTTFLNPKNKRWLDEIPTTSKNSTDWY